jgi:Immunity protein 53
MNSLHELQDWYLSQCNGDWEHTYGVSIGTLDNPGWSLEVELTDTNLEGLEFKERSYGIGKDTEPNGQDWMVCKVKDRKFVSYGGPRKLEEIISVFLAWAKQSA